MKVLKKCQNYRFLDISWDILNKIKDNLGRECAKERLLSFKRTNLEQFLLISLENYGFVQV